MLLGAWLVLGGILPASAGCSDGGHAGTAGTRPKSDRPDAGTVEADAGQDSGSPSACRPTPYEEICEPDDWCWKDPLPQGHDVEAVFVPESGEILTGVGSSILRRNLGEVWRKVPVDIDLAIAKLWGTDVSQVWAAGMGVSVPGGVIGRWDGTRWTEVHRSSTVQFRFTDIDGSGPADVWAVGEKTVVHFDGQVWSEVDISAVLPEGPSGTSSRVAVAARNDVWVAIRRRLLHWDGTSWTFEDVPLSITDIWAKDSTGAFRALSSGFQGTAEIQRWDGATWQPSLTVEPPGVTVLGFRIEELSGSSADDLWALDSLGTSYHFDVDVDVEGSTWSTLSTGAPFSALGLWAEGPGDPVIVGREGEIRRFVDGRWLRETRGVQASTSMISGTGPDDVWFAGAILRPAVPDAPAEPSLMHWDGVEIGVIAVPGATEPFTAVAAVDPGTVWVGGGGGFLARLHAGRWQRFAATSNGIQDIWGAVADDVWMVDSMSAAFHWDGRSWSAVALPISSVVDIHGSATDDVWMVGHGAARWDGRTWSAVPIDDGTAPVTAVRVWANARNDVWLRTVTIETTTQIRHFNGTSFEIVPTPFEEVEIHDIWSSRPGELYIGGEQVLRLHDGAWESFGPSLRSIWGSPDNHLWGASFGGTIMRRRFPEVRCEPGK
jgi:hypothetical protein